MEFVATVCTLGAGVVSCIIKDPASAIANVGMGGHLQGLCISRDYRFSADTICHFDERSEEKSCL